MSQEGQLINHCQYTHTQARSKGAQKACRGLHIHTHTVKVSLGDGGWGDWGFTLCVSASNDVTPPVGGRLKGDNFSLPDDDIQGTQKGFPPSPPRRNCSSSSSSSRSIKRRDGEKEICGVCALAKWGGGGEGGYTGC